MMDRRHFSAALLATLASSSALARADGKTELQRQLAEIEKASGGRLGVCILDTGSGLRAGHRPDERFPMCSTFKFLAAAAVLNRVDQGKERLERRIVVTRRDLIPHAPVTEKHVGEPGLTMAELCEAAVTLSDNPAANLMLASFGGPGGLTRYLRGLGDTQTRLDRNEPGLNESLPGDPRDTTTPAAMLDTMQKILLGDVLLPASRARIQAWLDGCLTGDKRLRAGVPADWLVGDKTGTGPRGSTCDIAILRPPRRAPILVTAYLTGTPASMEARDAALASVGAVVNRASRPQS
ncbi:class A beta-lactamase [Variovorax saccharolyticus]|uniref:class A beta-lactamase n=1 Tax=Variovorax saccharolyticus TaxID=3053516 RepID=UPI00257560B8|nr:class A beta-lactamase [Variovorax sp. J31P216]MDM0023686.1 class A beta-lactamase [Variovorax sp. J31P216]